MNPLQYTASVILPFVKEDSFFLIYVDLCFIVLFY